MTAVRIVETLNEGKHRTASLDLALEARAIEKLAFEGSEEALTHGVVIRITNRAHRRTHASLAAAATEFDRGVLRPLIGMMNDITGTAHCQRHVQRIEDQLSGERGGHRPARACPRAGEARPVGCGG